MAASRAVRRKTGEAKPEKRRRARSAAQRPPMEASSVAREHTLAEGIEVKLIELQAALRAVREGDFSARLSTRGAGPFAQIAVEFNELAAANQRMSNELVRVGRVIGREGRMTERAAVARAGGAWTTSIDALNGLIDDLVRPTTEVARVIVAVAEGDLTQKMALKIEGQPVKGEFLRIGTTVNKMVDQLSSFADEVTRVARQVGTDGKLGGQAKVTGVSGTWKDLTDSVNLMASNLTDQVRSIAQVTTAVAQGDLSQKITVEAKGEVAALADTINTMVDQLSSFADEVTRVAREVGTDGKLGGQAQVPGVAGRWKDLTDSVNFMASNLTDQVRNIAQVTTAVAQGDLSQKITVDVKGEILELKNTINTMVDQLSSFAAEVTRVAREVGTEGKLGGQAEVKGVSGTWRDLTENVNLMGSNLTDQVRSIAQVATAVAEGDLSQKITVEAKGEVAALADTINTMVEQLRSFAAEVTRVAREVGTEGKLGGQAEVEGVSGTWRGLTESVNMMASNLTDQVRNIAQVTTAVAKGDLSQKIAVDVKGELLELKNTINTMVDQLSSFAAEVTRVAREVGTEGELGGQAEVEDVSGTWRGLTESVNMMASNLTAQVRNIAQVTTAVAQGDLSQKITVEAQGEVAALSGTINTMVDQLRSFAAEVTRVASEVGTEGKLGGQAEVEGVSGTWRGLTENVNQLAGNLTTQVRAIAEVSTAVTQGDLTRSISVEAQGEVAELKDNINQMIANLRDTTKRNEEQDWLKTNLARISGLMQGQRDLGTVTQLIMSELTPTVSAQQGAFYLADHADEDGSKSCLRLIAGYGLPRGRFLSETLEIGEGLVGQAAVERKSIRIDDAPSDYVRISSGLGEVTPTNILVMPILFEGQVLGVIELASLTPHSEIHETFLEQLMETLGVVLNTIMANMRTEQLLQQSQSLTQELQTQSEELQRRQQDLKQSNREIELARLGLEEKAAQLALSSKYKSEFLANMSHELRTPLNSLLILSKLLLDNEHGTLGHRELEFARTIHAAGADLLQLISDILDLSKIEAGKMAILPDLVVLADVQDYVGRTFDPIAADKGLRFEVNADASLPLKIVTDEQRLEQILRNLLSNAFKFTEVGGVTLNIARASGERISFAVSDTGVGIAPEKLQVIFEAFQQADGTTSRKYGGTGLGLSISRELARALGGEIGVASTVEQGTTFTLTLPIRFASAFNSDGGETSERASVAAAVDGGSTHVEESRSEDARAPAARALQHAPANVVTAAANSGESEVSALDGASPAAAEGGDGHAARRALVVERGTAVADALGAHADGVLMTMTATAEEARSALEREAFDCVIVGHGIAKSAALTMLEDLAHDPRARKAAFILYPKRPLTGRERGRLRRIESTIAAQVAETPEELTAQMAMALGRGGDVPGSAEAERLGGGAELLLGRKVLLVDDDVRNLFALASLLEDRGLEVVFGESGQEALAVLERNNDVDLVLMDIMMPGIDGNETIAAIRRTPGFDALPIIAVTAKAMEGDREQSLAAGASDYITKPVEPDRLLSLIGSWLLR